MGDRGAVRTREGVAKSLRSVFYACFNTLASFFALHLARNISHTTDSKEGSSSKQADPILLRGGVGAGDIQERDI
jgi:hypothetical protein